MVSFRRKKKKKPEEITTQEVAQGKQFTGRKPRAEKGTILLKKGLFQDRVSRISDAPVGDRPDFKRLPEDFKTATERQTDILAQKRKEGVFGPISEVGVERVISPPKPSPFVQAILNIGEFGPIKGARKFLGRITQYANTIFFGDSEKAGKEAERIFGIDPQQALITDKDVQSLAFLLATVGVGARWWWGRQATQQAARQAQLRFFQNKINVDLVGKQLGLSSGQIRNLAIRLGNIRQGMITKDILAKVGVSATKAAGMNASLQGVSSAGLKGIIATGSKKAFQIGFALAGADIMFSWLASDNLLQGLQFQLQKVRKGVLDGTISQEEALIALAEAEANANYAYGFLQKSVRYNPLLRPFATVIMTNAESAIRSIDLEKELILGIGRDEAEEFRRLEWRQRGIYI